MSALRVRELGLLPYQPTWQAMQRFTNERGPDTPDPAAGGIFHAFIYFAVEAE